MLEKYSVDKRLIFERVTELHIFEYYFNKIIDLNEPHINPLRVDKEPGCWFYKRSDGRLIFNDFSWRQFDCFDIVQFTFKVSFYRALEIIYRDLIEHKGTTVNHIKEKLILQRSQKRITKLRIKRRKFKQVELDFWSLNGKLSITEEELIHSKIYCLECYWENNVLEDNCKLMFAYHWFDFNYQLYFPKIQKPYRRFINPHGIKWGDMEFVNHDESYLIITKSKKDAFYLRKFGFNAMFVVNEVIVLPQEFFDSVSHFEKIFTLFDNDRTGRKLSVKYRNLGCIPILISSEYGKDFTEFLQNNDLDWIVDLLTEMKNDYLTV